MTILKYIKNIFTYSSVLVIVVSSIFFPFMETVKAQALQGVGGQISSSVNVQGVGAIVLQCATSNGASSPFGQAIGGTVGGGVGGAVGESIGGETGQTIGTLLGTVGGGLLGNEIGNLMDQGVDSAVDSATSAIPGVGGMGQQVPVNVIQDSQTAENIEKSNEVIQEEEIKETKKEECLDRIAQWAAITVMDRMTLATLNWINSGFEGKPFYLENPEQFFSDLATKELLGFSATFSADPNLYPFGQTLARTVLLSFQRTFEQNMISNLNSILTGNQAQWQQDFSVGGWAGYTAYLEPNNNIFGAYLESSRNIGRNLAGTRSSTAVNIQAELQQGLGFLSQRICVETQNGGAYISENSIQHITVGVPEITQINQIPTNVYTYITSCGEDGYIFDEDGDGQTEDDGDGLCEGFDEDIIAIAEDFRGRSICTEWRNQTPGTLIAQSASDAIGTSKEQLLLVDELNENLGLILDAFLLQFIEQGVSYFNPNNEDNVLVQQVNGENPGGQNNSVPFIDAVNGFDQGNQGNFLGLVEIQQEYVEQVTLLLDLYDEQLQRTLDLDYCVPGPNPLWQIIASNAITNSLSLFPAYETFPQGSWVQATSQIMAYQPQVLQTFLAGLVGTVGSFPSSENPAIINGYINTIYTTIIEELTGVSITQSSVNPDILSKDSQFVPIMYSAFTDYSSVINERFILAEDFDGGVREGLYEYFFALDDLAESIAYYQNSLEISQQSFEELIDLREEYADIERDYIVEQLLIAVNEQGITTLADNLQTFQAFTDAQVTYIGNGNENSAYHNAVIALSNEVGSSVTPPTNYPGYGSILQDFMDIFPNIPSQQNLEDVNDEIEIVLENIGNADDGNSLIGLTYSCVQQVEEIGPYQNIPFEGYTERLPYPFPISTDIPGLPFLPTTNTFLENMTVSANASDITIDITPASAIGSSGGLEVFESMFVNLGGSLY